MPARCWIAGALALTLALGCAQARAENDAPEESGAVQTYWREGRRLFAAGRYAEAQAQFAQGYALSHRAAFLFNMAECARLVKDAPQARGLYLRYVKEHPKGTRREDALSRCKALAVGPCDVEHAPPYPGHAPPEKATPTSAPVSPVARAEESPASAPSASQPVAATSQPAVAAVPLAVPPAPPPARSRRFYQRWPFWVGVGAGVLTIIIAAAAAGTSGDRVATVPGDATLDWRR